MESQEISNQNLIVKKEEYILLAENGISDVGILPKQPESNWAAPILRKGVQKTIDFIVKHSDKIVALGDKLIKYLKNPGGPFRLEAIKQAVHKWWNEQPPAIKINYEIMPNSHCVRQGMCLQP